jgi:acyl-CoA thioester hydrolase
MKRKRRPPYFEPQPGDPASLTIRVTRRVLFSDADPMGVLWHGRYPAFFEAAAAELHRSCGLGYLDFRDAGVQAPIVKLHIDYLSPAFLEDELTVAATLHWCDAARMDTEYAITKAGGVIIASGYTVQLFVNAATRAPLLTTPAFMEASRHAWRAGDFASLR